jgi:Protein of unknown function (DUF2599)
MIRRLVGAFVGFGLAVAGPSLISPLVPANYLIDRTQWNNFGSYSPTLTIYPTVFGRIIAAPSGLASAIGLHALDQKTSTAFWNAALIQTPKNAAKIRTLTMHQQFNCHFYFASKNPFQDSWNIDTHRLPAGMNIQILNTCNYPLLTHG